MKDKISAASLLVNVPEFSKQAAGLIPKSHLHRLGLHFNLTEGTPVMPDNFSLVDRDGNFLGKSGFWSKHLSLDQVEVKRELLAQIELFTTLTGVRPAYIDGHQHVQCSRNVLPVLVEVMKNFNIPRLRVPLEPNWSATDWIQYMGLS